MAFEINALCLLYCIECLAFFLSTADDKQTYYAYDLAGRAVKLHHQAWSEDVEPYVNLTANSYDLLGRLFRRELYGQGAASPLALFEWTHDALARVTCQDEVWAASGAFTARNRATSMTYDNAGRLFTETITDSTLATVSTTYTYDDSHNRTGKQVEGGPDEGSSTYVFNDSNQLTSSTGPGGTVSYAYDSNGNRISRTQGSGTTVYRWNAWDKLVGVQMPDGKAYTYTHDYRSRRVGTAQDDTGGLSAKRTAIVFSGGLSVAEVEIGSSDRVDNDSQPTVQYTRGPDMGGGVGGLLYTKRSGTVKHNLSNGRGDIVAQSDASGALTWTASYEAYGKRTKETGTNDDKQRANSKDEDPTGLLNEGFRYQKRCQAFSAISTTLLPFSSRHEILPSS